MIIKSLSLKAVVSPILRGNIHGQGSCKKYVFLLVDTSEGVSFSEIYCGAYTFDCVQSIVQDLFKKIEGREIDHSDVINNTLHQPFVCGSGIYEVVLNAFYNAILLFDLSWKDADVSTNGNELYLSGGTVKTSLDEMRNEILYAAQHDFDLYKVRMDYRAPEDCRERLEVLNSAGIRYAIDLIVNTNHVDRKAIQLDSLLAHADFANLVWLEEPFFPTCPSEWGTVGRYCMQHNVSLALGESLTSMLELEFVLQHPGIAVIQIDATHCSNLKNLQEFQKRVLENGKALGYHNWGSSITLLLNGLLSESTGASYFEVPYYMTEFDQRIQMALACGAPDFAKPSRNLGDVSSYRPMLAQLIIDEPDRVYGDFRWS